MPPKDETPAQQPAGATGEQPAAPVVNPQENSAPKVTPKDVTVPEGYQLIKSEDINRLKSEADKAKNNGQQSDAMIGMLMQKDAVRDAVASAEFKEKYPDVTEEDLLDANPTDEDQIEAVAKNRQARYEKIKQDHIAKVQRVTAPEITPEDRDTKLKELSGANKPKNAFQQGLQLMRTRVKQ